MSLHDTSNLYSAQICFHFDLYITTYLKFFEYVFSHIHYIILTYIIAKYKGKHAQFAYVFKIIALTINCISGENFFAINIKEMMQTQNIVSTYPYELYRIKKELNCCLNSSWFLLKSPQFILFKYKKKISLRFVIFLAIM